MYISIYTCFGGCWMFKRINGNLWRKHDSHMCKVHTSWSCCFGFLLMDIEKTINNCLRTCANIISNHNVHACWLAMASTKGLNQFQKHVNAVLESPKRRFDSSFYTYLILKNFYLKYSSKPTDRIFPWRGVDMYLFIGLWISYANLNSIYIYIYIE